MILLHIAFLSGSLTLSLALVPPPQECHTFNSEKKCIDMCNCRWCISEKRCFEDDHDECIDHTSLTNECKSKEDIAGYIIIPILSCVAIAFAILFCALCIKYTSKIYSKYACCSDNFYEQIP